MIQRDVVVGHVGGVHALVAHDLAQLAARYSSSLFLRSEGGTASLASVVDVLALGLPEGARASVWADGLDETDALDAAVRLLSATP